MGCHHQDQDIQGLASQQPASADMVFLGAWRRSGGCLPAVYHVMGPEMHGVNPARLFGSSRTSARMVLSVGGVGNGWAFGARVLHSPQTFACWRCCSAGRGTARRRRPYAARRIAPRRRDSLATATAQLRPEIGASPPWTFGAATQRGSQRRWPSSPGTVK